MLALTIAMLLIISLCLQTKPARFDRPISRQIQLGPPPS